MPEFTVLTSDTSDVRQRKVTHAVRMELSDQHTQGLHAVFAAPSLMSMHIPIACEMLKQLQNADQAHVSIPLAGNGVIVDILINHRVSDDGTHSVYAIHHNERVRTYVPASQQTTASSAKRPRSPNPAQNLHHPPSKRSSTTMPI